MEEILMFTKKRIEYCNYAEFKEALNYARRYYTFVEGERPREAPKFNAYIEIKRTKVFLTYKKGSKVITYSFRLDGQENIQHINGMEAYRILKKYWPELPDLQNRKEFGYKETPNEPIKYHWNEDIATISAVIGFNKELSGKRYEDCYGYDLNSAFNFAMLNPMPDTTVEPKEYCKVKKNEIGFFYDDNGDFKIVKEGHFARYVFPLMDSPFKKFVDTWYSNKKNAKTPEEKQKAKNVLVMAVGYLQKHNPFLRAAIIGYSNEYISSFIDEDTLYWNTDSIVSRKRRLDIEENLGSDLGQWKIEHKGSFAYDGNNYQWNNDVPVVRGIPKNWFKKMYPNGFDVLKDEIPFEGNAYYIDKDDNYALKEIKYGQKKN
jgi:hypothetical protein